MHIQDEFHLYIRPSAMLITSRISSRIIERLCATGGIFIPATPNTVIFINTISDAPMVPTIATSNAHIQKQHAQIRAHALWQMMALNSKQIFSQSAALHQCDINEGRGRIDRTQCTRICTLRPCHSTYKQQCDSRGAKSWQRAKRV